MMRDLIRIVESASSYPSGFTDEGSGLLKFECPYGSGVIGADFSGGVGSVYEFNSGGKRGDGRRALNWLRQHFTELNVVDPGDEDGEAWRFWTKMQDEGLVDTLFDEDFNVLRGSDDE